MAGSELRVDATDLRIVRAILMGETYWRADRVSVDALAKELDLHPNTVHSRIRKLSGNRYFLPPSALVDPGPVGLFGSRVFLDLPENRRDDATRAQIFRVEGVHSTFEYLDGWDINVYAEDPEGVQARVELAAQITGTSRLEWETPIRPEVPLTSRQRLGSLDLRVILGLVKEFRRPLPRIAEEIGVSARTVERKFRELTARGTIRAFPVLEREASGMMNAYLRVDGRNSVLDDNTWNQILAAMPNHHARSRTRGRGWFFIHGPSLGDLTTCQKRIGKIPGVIETKMRFLLRIHTNEAFNPWLGRTLARRAALLDA